MQRIIFRHLSGSKANQVEEFPADANKELIFGRDDLAQVKYDPARDDLVSRQHAKVLRDPANSGGYVIEDLGSRNGTFLNKQRLTGRSAIAPGDVVQFGAGGPEFQFDLDPRPNIPARTREAAASSVMAPATREGNTMSGASTGVGSSSSVPQPSGEIKPTVGKATVERMIGETKKQGQKTTMFVGIASLGLVALVSGLFLINKNRSDSATSAQIKAAQGEISAAKASAEEANAKAEAAKAAEEEAKKNAPMTPAQIVAQNTGAIARIEVAWKLIFVRTGNQVYHETTVMTDQQGQKHVVPKYILLNGKLEPKLTIIDNGHPIGFQGSGSGFSVTNDGFMLTNRHVAAGWKTAYQFPPSDARGVLVDEKDTPIKEVAAPTDWVPSETTQGQGNFEGRNDYLYATFPGQDNRIAAKLTVPSEKHDVALIKIDTPGTVKKVELNDNYDTIKPGDAAIVLGYPGISPSVYGMVRSQDVFNRNAKIREIPDPTVSVGNIGRLLRGNEIETKKKGLTYSSFGDVYQLTINSTGHGNSGGPMFDDHGKVTGIFFAGKGDGGTNITFAVPIRFGMELMGAAGGDNGLSTPASDSSASATTAPVANTAAPVATTAP